MTSILKFLFSSTPRRSGSGKVLDLAPTKIYEIETAQERPSRALKHLLRLNHVSNAVLWNNRIFHNHAPHVSALHIYAHIYKLTICFRYYVHHLYSEQINISCIRSMRLKIKRNGLILLLKLVLMTGGIIWDIESMYHQAS